MKGRMVAVSIMVEAVAFLGVAFAWAAGFTGSQQFNNAFETTGINVRIDQFCETREGIKEIDDETDIMPGKRISYIPRVTNMEEESYVRVKFDFRLDGNETREITADCITEVDKKWIRKGSYYYCSEPLKAGEQEDVFRALDIPKDFGVQPRTLTIYATVEAIQAKNFTPDFSNAGPWGTVAVKEVYRYTEKSESLRVVSLPSMDFSYISEGTFECETKDLFSRFGSFQPGDTCSESLEMKNQSAKTMDIFFRTENQKTELLETMRLVIKCGNREIYRGSLASEKLGEYMKIATVEPGNAGMLAFEINMPVEADNRYAMLKDNVNWIFAVSEAGSEKSEQIERGEKPEIAQTEKSEINDSNVKTGDSFRLIAIAFLLAMSALTGTAIVLILGKGKGGGNE